MVIFAPSLFVTLGERNEKKLKERYKEVAILEPRSSPYMSEAKAWMVRKAEKTKKKTVPIRTTWALGVFKLKGIMLVGGGVERMVWG